MSPPAVHGFTDEAATRHMHEQFATTGIEQPRLLIDPPDQAELVAAEIVTRLAAGNLTHSPPERLARSRPAGGSGR